MAGTTESTIFVAIVQSDTRFERYECVWYSLEDHRADEGEQVMCNLEHGTHEESRSKSFDNRAQDRSVRLHRGRLGLGHNRFALLPVQQLPARLDLDALGLVLHRHGPRLELVDQVLPLGPEDGLAAGLLPVVIKHGNDGFRFVNVVQRPQVFGSERVAVPEPRELVKPREGDARQKRRVVLGALGTAVLLVLGRALLSVDQLDRYGVGEAVEGEHDDDERVVEEVEGEGEGRGVVEDARGGEVRAVGRGAACREQEPEDEHGAGGVDALALLQHRQERCQRLESRSRFMNTRISSSETLI